MKVFLKICKWVGITAIVGVVSLLISVGCLAKNNEVTFGEQFNKTLGIEKVVDQPENEENSDIVDVPEIEDENTAE